MIYIVLKSQKRIRAH